MRVYSVPFLALWANYPVAVAPGMGLNAFFAYTVVLGQGLSWQTALGAVFISGVVFLILTITGIRQKIVDGVPNVLKSAIGVGIGLFIAFIGFSNAKLIVANDATFVALGDVTSLGPLLALLGLIVAAFLMAKKIKGALLISILATSIIAMITGFIAFPKSISDIVSLELPSLADTFLAMDIKGAIAYGIISVIFSFTIVELFDNLATLIGLTKKAGLVEKNGKTKEIHWIMYLVSIAFIINFIMGGH